jgi:hypothetical protein
MYTTAFYYRSTPENVKILRRRNSAAPGDIIIRMNHANFLALVINSICSTVGSLYGRVFL